MANMKDKHYNFNSVDLLIYIWQKRVILVIVGLIAGISSIIISLLITPMFESSVIMFPSSNASVSKDLLALNYSNRQSVHGFGEEEQAEQLLQILNSEPIRARIIEKYQLMDHYEIHSGEKYPLTKLYEEYRSNIKFRLTEFMSVEITVRDKDPVYASDMANDICDLVDTVYNNMKKERAREAFRLVEREYKEASANLVALRDTMDHLSEQISQELNRGGNATENLIRAISNNGALYIPMMYQLRARTTVAADLSMKYQEARLEMEQDLPHKFVVQRAFPAEKKAYPKKSLIVIASTFSSLLFALIVLIVIDNIRERTLVRKEEE